jgi:hypothetical protein
MHPVINVRFGRILPLPIHAAAALLLVFVLLAFYDKPIATGVVALLALAVFTATEGTEIDVVAKKYREYHSVFFVKGGEWVSYGSIEKLYVNRNRMKQTMSTLRSNHTSDFVFYEYSIFVKFDDEEKIQLKKGKNKDTMMKLASAWSQQLSVPLADNTGEADA